MATVALGGCLALIPISSGWASSALPVKPHAALSELTNDQLMAKALEAFRAEDFATARSHFRLLAQRENATAETLLGTMAAKGQGSDRNDAIAAAWFLRAARRGYAPAQYALADAFAHGRGVPQDYVRARSLAKAAASQGQPGAAQLASRLGPERYAALVGGRP